MKQLQACRRLAPAIALWAFAMASSAAFAQPEGTPPPPDLTPLGTPVELDGTCANAPTAFATEDGPIAVWQRFSDPAGLAGRSGPSLDQLLGRLELNGDSVIGGVSVAPAPGGFVAAWIRTPASQIPEAVFQRFGADLHAEAAEVVVGPASAQGSPALVLEPFGVVLIAYYGPAGTVQTRRYSSADLPLIPLIDVDPTVVSEQRSRIRVAAGVNQFLVAWEGALPAQTAGLWVRAISYTGAPAAASVRIASLGEADFDVAWTLGQYLAVVPGGNVWGYRLATNGSPTAPVGLLAPAKSPRRIELTPGDGVLWLSFIEEATGLVVSRIELPSLTVYENPVLLVPEPAGMDYLERGSVRPSGEGLVAAWQLGVTSPISLPCAGAQGIYAQAFGPAPPAPGGVDVPALPPAGLLALALLIAAGGLLALRR